ncbi:unnamed protein product [Natator depressus]
MGRGSIGVNEARSPAGVNGPWLHRGQCGQIPGWCEWAVAPSGSMWSPRLAWTQAAPLESVMLNLHHFTAAEDLAPRSWLTPWGPQLPTLLSDISFFLPQTHHVAHLELGCYHRVACEPQPIVAGGGWGLQGACVRLRGRAELGATWGAGMGTEGLMSRCPVAFFSSPCCCKRGSPCSPPPSASPLPPHSPSPTPPAATPLPIPPAMLPPLFPTPHPLPPHSPSPTPPAHPPSLRLPPCFIVPTQLIQPRSGSYL